MRKKITPAALSKIPFLLDQGLGAAEIADAVGCTVGTLRVRCSQMGISLRRRKRNDCGAAKSQRGRVSCEAVRKGDVKGHAPTTCRSQSHPAITPLRNQQPVALRLPRKIIDQLRRRAALKGISDSKLASMLLEVIARDGLYDAVLDGNEDAGTLSQSEKRLG